jgi:YVTN family beta-propeller protein
VTEIKIPAYGNDASAIDFNNDKLYVASWAYGEIDVIDLKIRSLKKRVRNIEILPHMFSMDFLNSSGDLVVPLGATAVNGSHGAALTLFSVNQDFSRRRLLTGWAPVDLVQVPGDSAFLVFNSEDVMAVVNPDGSWESEVLPVTYPRLARVCKQNLYLAYGPHQSYWPTVYIWAARNGILEIEPKRIETTGRGSQLNFQTFDRRTPRLAHDMAVDSLSRLYALQNSWGREKLMLSYFPEGIRLFGPQVKVAFEEPINRETIPRILKYDRSLNRLYMMVLGNTNEDNGRVLIIDASDQSLIRTVETGLTPTDLVFDEKAIYIANFDENTVSRIDKSTQTASKIRTGEQPFRLAKCDNDVYVINYGSSTLQNLSTGKKIKLGFPGKPDFLFAAEDRLIISMHSPNSFDLILYDPSSGQFNRIHHLDYPYGELGFDTVNASFSTPGQFGDAIFTVNQMKLDDKSRLWVTDFLSGRLLIVDEF